MERRRDERAMSHEAAICEASDRLNVDRLPAEEDLGAFIRAYLDARGLVMVPREATPAMRAEHHRGSIAPIGSLSVYGYRSMLAAAPDPFEEGE